MVSIIRTFSEHYPLDPTYGASKFGKLCLFSYLQVASGHKYNQEYITRLCTLGTVYNKVHEYPHTKMSMHVRGQHGKGKTLLLLFMVKKEDKMFRVMTNCPPT